MTVHRYQVEPIYANASNISGDGTEGSPFSIIGGTGGLSTITTGDTFTGEGRPENPLMIDWDELPYLQEISHDTTILGNGKNIALSVAGGTGGGISSVTTTDTITGNGTVASPIGVVWDELDYLEGVNTSGVIQGDGVFVDLSINTVACNYQVSPEVSGNIHLDGSNNLYIDLSSYSGGSSFTNKQIVYGGTTTGGTLTHDGLTPNKVFFMYVDVDTSVSGTFTQPFITVLGNHTYTCKLSGGYHDRNPWPRKVSAVLAGVADSSGEGGINFTLTEYQDVKVHFYW